jgi:hypothetical protein
VPVTATASASSEKIRSSETRPRDKPGRVKVLTEEEIAERKAAHKDRVDRQVLSEMARQQNSADLASELVSSAFQTFQKEALLSCKRLYIPARMICGVRRKNGRYLEGLRGSSRVSHSVTVALTIHTFI